MSESSDIQNTSQTIISETIDNQTIVKKETRGRKKKYFTETDRKASKNILNKQSYDRVKEKNIKMTDLCCRFIQIMNNKKMKKYTNKSDFDNELLSLQIEMLNAFN